MRLALTAALALALFSCGGEDGLAFLGVRVESASAVRRFPPATPEPLYVNLRVFRSDRLFGPMVANLDVAWKDIGVDPASQKKTLAMSVPANADKNYDYLLRVASVVDDGHGGLIADECGMAGFLRLGKGERRQVKVTVHAGSCSPLYCQKRLDCLGERYCLAFECYDQKECGSCPAGAGCDTYGKCTGDCLSDGDCSNAFRCCRGICSLNCPDW